jgi:thiol-disulfide isomerase/thioredoxin
MPQLLSLLSKINTMLFRGSFFIILLLPMLFPPQAIAKPISETKIVSDDLEVVVMKHPAEGKQLLLWIAPSFGFRQGHSDMAQLLSQQGFEVWQADINEALFIPHNSTSMRELNAKYVSDLIETAHSETGKKVVLISGSYGAIPVLRGAREWQLTKPDSRYLLGIVLFSPNVYHSIPPLGTEPEFLPIAYATNIPIVIIQGDMNSNRWQVDKLATALRSGGSAVHIELVENVVGLFYGEERKPHIEKYFHHFAETMKNQIDFFNKHPYSLVANKIEQAKTASGTGLDIRLKPFKGDANPHPIRLKDINGNLYNITDYKNRVTVVNFWATWCTPCIKEIPSLNNLRDSMQGKPFELISINYAEEAQTIKEFMQMVDVGFPVLLDEQGQQSANWKVIVFPSTFIIGRDGKIHYGVNAGIEWDTPEVLSILNKLLEK